MERSDSLRCMGIGKTCDLLTTFLIHGRMIDEGSQPKLSKLTLLLSSISSYFLLQELGYMTENYMWVIMMRTLQLDT